MKDIAKKSNTLYLLDKYQLHATKKFGQNFLVDLNTVKRIVASAKIDKDTCVIEIGPGIGALTEQLAAVAGHVRCYEIDIRLKEVLAESLAEVSNVDIVFQDFLTVDLKQVVAMYKQEYRRVCIVANLPYYITSDILEFIVQANAELDSVHAMVQKEVAEKLTNPQYHSPLTFMIESIGSIHLDMSVSQHVFMPRPHVDSAILSIQIERQYHPLLTSLLKQAFAQKRKTIFNNLKDLFQDETREILKACQIEEQQRAEALCLEDYMRILKYLEKRRGNHEDPCICEN